MPSSETILAGLANDYRWLAVAVHVYIGALVVLAAAGRLRSKKIAAILIALPLLSVSILAWLSGNPFNGALFAVFAVALLALAIRLPAGDIQFAPAPVAMAGFALLFFGWIYPHFLENANFISYLYSAPTGIIPCPTLSVVIGLTLIAGSFQSRPWGFVAAGAGLFYGLFGALRLGVSLDWFLAAGAAGLLGYVMAKGSTAFKSASSRSNSASRSTE